MGNIKAKIDTITIEDKEDGFCIVTLGTNGKADEPGWLEIHGNVEKAEYPLILETIEDIDTFCYKLKKLLKEQF